jgi:hypothetical protein
MENFKIKNNFFLRRANKGEGIIMIGARGEVFTASRSGTKSFLTIACASILSHVECVMAMQRNGHSFLVISLDKNSDTMSVASSTSKRCGILQDQ